MTRVSETPGLGKRETRTNEEIKGRVHAVPRAAKTGKSLAKDAGLNSTEKRVRDCPVIGESA